MVYTVLRLLWGFVALLSGKELPNVVNLDVAAEVLEPKLRKSKRLGPKFEAWEAGRPGRVVPLVVTFLDGLADVWHAGAPAGGDGSSETLPDALFGANVSEPETESEIIGDPLAV